VKRLNLGCGGNNVPGFFGVDRFLLPGVHVVADLDAPLPFRDDTFDLVFASHALEHVADLFGVLREIWRVSRGGAQLCIAAPYYSQGLNFANPYHKQVFNEHTPRFWTNSPRSGVDPEEYRRPTQSESWGLAGSDNSEPGFDLRCLRMEFFYFEEYRPLAPREQRMARRKFNDVCDQVLYHLVVFKPPLTEEGLSDLRPDFFDPPALAARR
jgi:SAM-dependent methyltransferase